MAGFVPRGRAESALRFLPQKIAVFEPFHAANHMLAIRELLERLPQDERFDMEALAGDVLDDFAKKAFGPRAWTDEDDAKGEGEKKLEEALDRLVKAVRDAEGLSKDEKHDLALEAKIVAV